MQLKITLAAPIYIDIEEAQPPQGGHRAVFTTEINGITFKGENVSEILGVGHYATVTVEWKDAHGNPAKVDGPTKWESTDPAVLTVTVSTGNPLIANAKAIAIGSAQIHATADADLGEGIKTVTSTIDVTVIAGEAVGGEMTFEDMGSGPPPDKAGNRPTAARR